VSVVWLKSPWKMVKIDLSLALNIATGISSVALIIGAFIGIFAGAFFALKLIVCIYIIVAGFLLLGSIVPLKIVSSKALEYFPFLVHYRGRAFYLLLFGVLATGVGIPGIVAGVIAIITAVFAFILSFKSSTHEHHPDANATTDYHLMEENKQHQQPHY